VRRHGGGSDSRCRQVHRRLHPQGINAPSLCVEDSAGQIRARRRRTASSAKRVAAKSCPRTGPSADRKGMGCGLRRQASPPPGQPRHPSAARSRRGGDCGLCHSSVTVMTGRVAPFVATVMVCIYLFSLPYSRERREEDGSRSLALLSFSATCFSTLGEQMIGGLAISTPVNSPDLLLFRAFCFPSQ
jgi:hypothetical protein